MRFLISLFKFGVLAVVISACWLAWFALTPVAMSSRGVDFSIEPGGGMRSVVREINAQGIAVRPWAFTLLARLSRSDTAVKAGSYEAEQGITPWRLLRKITQGDYTQSEIALIEGWTFRQMRDTLDANPDIKHDALNLPEDVLMTRLGAPGEKPEGWFFPETYFFARGTSDVAILARAHRAMQKQLESAWSARAADTPLASPYEALILASLVEKETGNPADRARVAAVFVNRIRAGMKLQTDPSVIYGIGERYDGNLHKRDLVTDTPFNTYTRAGLPPAPIAMPGLASLMAATNPAHTDDLYFVSRGDGTSYFSKSLDEHNRAVARYQKPAHVIQ
jgi:UPF0755 protein